MLFKVTKVMFDVLFSGYSYNPKLSMQYEKDMINAAIAMMESGSRAEPNFPKCNVYRYLDGSPYDYFYEFALAGYSKESLEVKLDGGYLVVSSKTNSGEKEKEGKEYLHRGMARRDFSSKFYVGKDMELKEAKFADGLLTVKMEKLVPEEKKPKSISIT